jgi:hypothetical protein
MGFPPKIVGSMVMRSSRAFSSIVVVSGRANRGEGRGARFFLELSAFCAARARRDGPTLAD